MSSTHLIANPLFVSTAATLEHKNKQTSDPSVKSSNIKEKVEINVDIYFNKKRKKLKKCCLSNKPKTPAEERKEKSNSNVIVVSKRKNGITKNKNNGRNKDVQKKYEGKNFLRILMNAIIDKVSFNNFRDKYQMPILLKTKFESIVYPLNFNQLISLDEFISWVRNEKLQKKLSCTYEFKIFFAQMASSLDWRTKHFLFVFRNVIIWFLENEVYDCFIFEKKFPSVHPSKYLTKIPIFLNLACKWQTISV